MRRLLPAIVAYVAILSAFAVVRWNLWTYGTDTGTFTQAIADALGGFRDGPEQGTHFRFHWAPLLATLAPLVALGRTGLVLQLAQAVLAGATALPLYGIARGYVGEERASAYACLALVYPPLAAVAFTEFHEIAFYPVLALGIFWAAERAQWGWFALFSVLSAGVREEACIVLAIAGLAFAVVGWRNRGGTRARGEGLLAGTPREAERLVVAGAFLTLVNLGALALYFTVVIPRIGAWAPSRFYEYPFAHGPLETIAALVLHPQYLAQVMTWGRLSYLLEALVPLALLPLFSRWSLLALPGLGVVLLSSDPIAWRMGSHYAAIWIPWLLLGAIAALVRFERSRRPAYGAPSFATRWYAAALALCVIFVVPPLSPLHPIHYLRAIYPHDDAERVLALVPRGAHLLTHDEWFTQVAYEQRNATVFFCPFVDAVAVADDYPNGYYHDAIAPEVERELATGRMRQVAAFGHARLYARTPTPGSRPGDCVTPGDVRYRDLPTTLGTAPRR